MAALRGPGSPIDSHLGSILADGEYVVVVDLPPEREMAIALAMNNHAGERDRELLIDALDELTKVPEFDVELTGLTVAQNGTIWHRLSCAADSTPTTLEHH